MHPAKAIRGLALTAALVAIASAAPFAAEGTWSPAGSMSEARYWHAATALLDGRVLVTGGISRWYLASAEIYDPATNRWTPAAPMNVPRYQHTLTTLRDGRVLAAGGSGPAGRVASAEIYDPVTNTWVMGASLHFPREGHSATLLPSGRVLVVGSYPYFEIYDPATDSWTHSGTANVAMSGSYYLGATVTLSDGRILVTGGCCYSATTEIYDPATGAWSPAGSMSTGRYIHVAAPLPDGRALAAGGYAGSILSSTDIWSPSTNSWTPGPPMNNARYGAVAAARRDGRVLVAGGYDGWFSHSAELYDPAANAWVPAPPMSVGRYLHTATEIPGGRILVVGGYGGGGENATAEIFGPPNTPPTADAGSDQTVPGCASCVAVVTVDGSASADADGDVLTYTWKLGMTTLAMSRDPVKTASVQLGLGTHVLTLVVSDGEKTATDDLVVVVQDGSAEQAARIAALQADVDALGANNAALQAENDSLNAGLADAIRAVESDLRATFSDPRFAIGGVTAMDRLRALVLALQQLERGRKLGIYTNLGGQPGAGSK